MNRKKVGILLRVSTKMQASQSVGEDDIPTQRTACMRFIDAHPDWAFEKEYLEIGVSGFKNTFDDRDKLLEARGDITCGKIDVLLVFMFDRLGRIAEETPLVLKDFIDRGAEVWSVKEGQRKLDQHIDHLLNYITFWQASGESKKTSVRVTEAMTQMAEDGKYVGGKAPFGYKAVPTGNITKKGLPEKTFVIDENEAWIVRKIFELVLTYGYGCHRITQYLNENGITNRSGGQFGHAAISNMLRNPIYKGVKAYNRTTTKGMRKGEQKRVSQDKWVLGKKNPEWEIVSEEVWSQVQQRSQSNKDRINELREKNLEIDDIQLSRTKLLFGGYAYCGYCGAKMITGYSPYRWKTEDGVTHRRSSPLYKCCGKSSGKLGCDAKSSYRPDGIEGTVLEEVKGYLNMLKDIELSAEIQKLQRNNTALEEKTVKELKREKGDKAKEKKALEDEVVKSLMGQSSFETDLLNRLFSEKSDALADVEKKLAEAQTLLDRKKLEQADLVQLKEMIPVWQDEFDNAPHDVKKVLLSKIVERVDIYTDKVEVKLRMYIEDFINGSTSGQKATAGAAGDLTPNGVYCRPN